MVHSVKRRAGWAIGLLLASLGPAVPALAAEEACQALANQGLRNVTRKFGANSVDRAAFKKHCKKQGQRYTFDDEASFGWYFQATGSPSISATQREAWCQEKASRYESDSVSIDEVETFSVEALRTFVACVELSRKDVLVDASIENDVLSVSIASGHGRAGWVAFNFVENDLDCWISGPNPQDPHGQPVIYQPWTGQEPTQIPFVQDLRVNLTCRRNARSAGAGDAARWYGETTVTVSTSLAKPMQIPLSAVTELTAESTAALREEHQRALAELRAELTDPFRAEWPKGPYCIWRVAEQDPPSWQEPGIAWGKGCPPGFNAAAWRLDGDAKVSDAGASTDVSGSPGAAPLISGSRSYANPSLCCKKE